MIVDDDALMTRLYQGHLERAGYRLVVAASGRQAIALALSERPAVIVMDIMMADMDGLSALRELKGNELTKTIPVIVVSAHPEYRMCQQEALGSGASTFLPKPFAPAQLLSEIQRLVVPSADASG